jgi:hypothetical protein
MGQKGLIGNVAPACGEHDSVPGGCRTRPLADASTSFVGTQRPSNGSNGSAKTLLVFSCLEEVVESRCFRCRCLRVLETLSGSQGCGAGFSGATNRATDANRRQRDRPPHHHDGTALLAAGQWRCGQEPAPGTAGLQKRAGEVAARPHRQAEPPEASARQRRGGAMF